MVAKLESSTDWTNISELRTSTEIAALLQARAGTSTVAFVQTEDSAEVAPSRRQQIIASMPSAADLDLIVIDPPAEWLADKGWK